MALLAKIVVTGRAHERRPVRLDGTLRLEDEPFDVTIDDISPGGFRASTDVDLRPGDRVRIGAPAIRTHDAAVVWAHDGVVGFEFLEPLSEQDVASAQPVNTVVPLMAGDPTPSAALPQDIPEPVVDKWPLPLRAVFILGSSIALWALIVALVRLL